MSPYLVYILPISYQHIDGIVEWFKMITLYLLYSNTFTKILQQISFFVYQSSINLIAYQNFIIFLGNEMEVTEITAASSEWTSKAINLRPIANSTARPGR